MLKKFIKIFSVIIILSINFLYINHLKVKNENITKEMVGLQQDKQQMADGIIALLIENDSLQQEKRKLEKQIDRDHNI